MSKKQKCRHCNLPAQRRRPRKGTDRQIPLCDRMSCLRKEWTEEDLLATIKHMNQKVRVWKERENS